MVHTATQQVYSLDAALFEQYSLENVKGKYKTSVASWSQTLVGIGWYCRLKYYIESWNCRVRTALSWSLTARLPGTSPLCCCDSCVASLEPECDFYLDFQRQQQLLRRASPDLLAPPLGSSPLLLSVEEVRALTLTPSRLCPGCRGAAADRLAAQLLQLRRCSKISSHGGRTADLSTSALFLRTTCVWSQWSASDFSFYILSKFYLESSTQPTQFQSPETTSQALDRRKKR